MSNVIKSYKSSKTEARKSKIHGLGMFAKENIKKGELIIIKSGHIESKNRMDELYEIVNGSEMQISDKHYLIPLTKEEFGQTICYLNHSCEPNVGIIGDIMFFSMRDIPEGEELTMDYSMHRTDNDFTMDCLCGLTNCRKTITGDDWKRKDLQGRYGRYFASYILEKIKNETE
jgi:SET domain-containing protein